MAAKKWLVIDADIAQAAGGVDALHPTSVSCRDFLESVLKICHHAIITREIKEEWDNHQSIFANRWRYSMMSKGKLHFIKTDIDVDKTLREKINHAGANKKDLEAMLKDIHLIEAALKTDETVISGDERVRKLFASASSKSVSEIKNVVWVNPCYSQEESIQWLKKGAKTEKQRMIGQFVLKRPKISKK